MQCTLMYIKVMIKKDGRPVKVVTNKPTLFPSTAYSSNTLLDLFFDGRKEGVAIEAVMVAGALR